MICFVVYLFFTCLCSTNGSIEIVVKTEEYFSIPFKKISSNISSGIAFECIKVNSWTNTCGMLPTVCMCGGYDYKLS